MSQRNPFVPNQGLIMFAFVNDLFMKEIQNGIQAGHAQQELMNKYFLSPGAAKNSSIHTRNMLKNWALNHKTWSIKRGGILRDLKEKVEFLEYFQLKDVDNVRLPYASFHEDEDCLGGILTSVAVVVPETLYKAEDYRTTVRNHPDPEWFQDMYPEHISKDHYFYVDQYDSRKIVWNDEEHAEFIKDFLKAPRA